LFIAIVIRYRVGVDGLEAFKLPRHFTYMYHFFL